MSSTRLGPGRLSRRALYRRGKRTLLRLLAPRWLGPHRAMEPAVRRFLRPRSRGELSSLLRDRRVALAMAAALLASAPAAASPPVELSDVASGIGGFVINGSDLSDSSGRSVSGAGDVNGDGLADLIVGARDADPGGESRAGESYVVFGKADGTAVDLATVTAGTGGFVINGIDAYDYSGSSVSGAGDVNGDGLADLVVGAPGAFFDLTDPLTPGESYVVFGKASTGAVDLADVAGGVGGFVIGGIDAGDLAGFSVSGAGDVNGDGLADLIVGAPKADPGGGVNGGESYVVFGKADGAAVDLADVALGIGGFVISGQNGDDYSGRSVAGAGDVNGDDLADLIVGAVGADPGGDSRAGESYVVFGKATTGAVSLVAVAAGNGGFVLNGIDVDDFSGISVVGAGDVNGDGLADLIVGAAGGDPGGDANAGESYVVFGKADTTGVDLADVAAGTGGFVINGIDEGDLSGRSVSGTGDVNGDGLDDLIVGAYGASPGGDSFAGESYVIFGKDDGTAVDLASLAGGTGGFVINGIDESDFSGRSVSGAGDVNGDGLDDLIVGAPYADPGGSSNAGESYVIFSPVPCPADDDGAPVELFDVAAGIDGFVINGIDGGDASGASVSDAGDVNGDGLGDVIVGAVNADPGGDSAAGESYVVFGKADGTAVDLADVATSGPMAGGFVINGIDVYDGAGISVSGAGDVNGDGLDDVIVGADWAYMGGAFRAGESYVVFGKASTTAVELADVVAGGPAAGGFLISGIDIYDLAGRSVSGAGDVNGDGHDDVIVGAFAADPGGTSQAGESYVVFGKAGTAAVDLADVVAGTGGFVINGIDAYDRSGHSVSGAGDVNGDGLADLVVGAPEGDPGIYSNAGESYVIFGKPGTTAVELSAIGAGSGGFVINGIDPFERSGFSVSGAGDVNGDGLADLVVGAPYADPGGNADAGESYVVFGKAGTAAVELADVAAGTGGFVITGIGAADLSGWSVSGAGDVNVDGFDDVIVGAKQADRDGLSNVGESYLVFGKADTAPVDLLDVATCSGGFVIKGIDADDQSGVGVSGAGDVNGDGAADLIVGANLADPLGISNAGESYIIFGPTPCLADCVGVDDEVNVTDLLTVLAQWSAGSNPGTDCDVDDGSFTATSDGVTNVSDLLYVLAKWGACP